MKSSLVKFHPTYLVVALGFVLTGYFINLIIFTSIIIIHELGHCLAAKNRKINIKEIIIYPYGGITKLDDLINRDIDDELLVAVSGIIIQTIYYIIILFLYKNNIIREYIFNIFTSYHYAILLFNIIPIYPLDGFKIINLLLSKIISYKKVNNITFFMSLIILILLFIINYYKFNYTYVLITSVLVVNLVTYYKSLSYLFNKFLLERYLYNIKYNNIKIVNKKEKMYKNYTHIIKNNNKYIEEQKFLSNMFDKR